TRWPRFARRTAAASVRSGAAETALVIKASLRKPGVKAFGKVFAMVAPEFHVDDQRRLDVVGRGRQFCKRHLRHEFGCRLHHWAIGDVLAELAVDFGFGDV